MLPKLSRRNTSTESSAVPGKEIFTELLSFHTSASGGDDLETVIQQSLYDLNRIQLTEAVQRKPDHEVVLHIPAGITRVHQSRRQFRKHFFYERSLRAEGDPLSQVWTDADGYAVAELRRRGLGLDLSGGLHYRRRGRGLVLLVFADVLDVSHHARQFVVLRLLVQLFEVGELFREHHSLAAQVVEDVAEHLAVAVDEVVLLEAVEHYGHVAVEHSS